MAYQQQQQQQQQQPMYQNVSLAPTRSLRIAKRPEPIQIKRTDTFQKLMRKEALEEQKSPESIKSPESEGSANSSNNSLVGYNQNINYSNGDLVSGGVNGPDSGSGSGSGYGPLSGGGISMISANDNYSDGASIINSIIDANNSVNIDADFDDVSPGGVYLNDDNNNNNNNNNNNQYYDNSTNTNTNMNMSNNNDYNDYPSQPHTGLPFSPRNGGGGGGGVGGGEARFRLGGGNGNNRNKLNEIFDEPINISDYVNNSDKNVWLLKLISKLSNDLNKIFKSSADFDVVIEVGQEPNTKIFHSHSTILRARSPFFSNAINNEWVRDEYGKFYFRKANVTPKVFECIISYVYTGLIKIPHLIPAEILELLVACDELILGELIDYLQGHLIANHYKWFQQNIVLIQKISFQHESFEKLQKFCKTLVFDNPKILFHSKDFVVVDKEFFLMLLNQDDLVMEENEIWDYVIHWGRSQNIQLSKKLEMWSPEDFRLLGYTLRDFIPLIRFSEISSKDFYKKIKPYSQILGTNLYEELLQHYLVADSQPNSDILTRKRKQKNLDSLLINQLIVALMSSWIDRKEKPYDEAQLPYKFELILRGTRDDFSAKTFHDQCDNVERTVVVMRIKGTTKLVGGYNPVCWNDDTGNGTNSGSTGGSNSNNYGLDGSGGVGGGYFIETRDSFIFTFDAKKSKKHIVSRVNNADKAIYHHENTGLNFLDLKMRGNSEDDEKCYYRQFVYDKNLKIKTTKENNFSIDEYEVFRVITL